MTMESPKMGQVSLGQVAGRPGSAELQAWPCERAERTPWRWAFLKGKTTGNHGFWREHLQETMVFTAKYGFWRENLNRKPWFLPLNLGVKPVRLSRIGGKSSSGWWLSRVSKNYVGQLGWWNSQLIWKNKIDVYWCSKPAISLSWDFTFNWRPSIDIFKCNCPEDGSMMKHGESWWNVMKFTIDLSEHQQKHGNSPWTEWTVLWKWCKFTMITTEPGHVPARSHTRGKPPAGAACNIHTWPKQCLRTGFSYVEVSWNRATPSHHPFYREDFPWNKPSTHFGGPPKI